ncbi:MAG: hypothetical protein J6B77_08310 [Clostridia bacterium]|nr:hypothetical protein [Clostridia bacterium]
MKSFRFMEAVTHLDDALLEKYFKMRETNKRAQRRRLVVRWSTVVAALLVVAIVLPLVRRDVPTGDDPPDTDAVTTVTTEDASWYLTADRPAPEALSVSDAVASYVIKVPTSAVERIGEIDVLLELFEETWRFGSYMQCRITLTNRWDESFLWYANDPRLFSIENSTGSMGGVRFLTPLEDVEVLMPGGSKTVEFLLPLSPVGMSLMEPLKGVIRILSPETGEQSAAFPVAVGRPVTAPETWYIDAWELPPELLRGLESDGSFPIVPIGEGDLALNVPLTYASEVGGISLKAEFFKESYRIGEIMQVRFTLTNRSETDFTFRTDSFCASPMTVVNLRTDKKNRPIVHMSPWNKKDAEGFGWTFVTNLSVDAICEFTLPQGESIVLENAYYIAPHFYDEGGEYTFDFSLEALIDPNWDYGGNLPTLHGEIDFGSVPVRMVELTE